MAKYRDIAQDLRRRIGSGEFGIGSQLPSIAELMEHYQVPGLNTIRSAQQLLVDDGLLETRQGIGVFVLVDQPRSTPRDVLDELKSARDALTRAITALEKQ
jgi:DNA-binding GntR family transcriptional regulator